MFRVRSIQTIFLCTILAFSAPDRVLSQGEYLARGENGIGISASGVLAGNSNFLGAGAGFSFKSRVDIGLFWGENFLDQDLWGPSAHRTGWGPSATIHLLKPSREFPVSISAFAGISFFNYSGTESSFASRITESFASSVGMSMFFDIPLGEKLRIIPINDFGLTRSSVYITDDKGREVNDKEDDFFWTVSLPVLYRLHNDWQIFISPDLTSTDSRFYFGLSAGVVLGWSGHKNQEPFDPYLK